MAGVFKRAKRNGRYSWYIRYRDSFGKVIRKRVPAKTKREAELYLAKVLDEIADGTYEIKLHQKQTKFFEIADDFMEYSKAHKRTWDKDFRTVQKLKQYFGNIPCEKITRALIENYIALRRKGEGGFRKPVKPATINRELACLKTIFRRAWLEKKIAQNPMAGFKLLPEDNVRDRVLDEQEFQRLLFSAPFHLKPILITAWETGMRRGEILNLKWEQVDLKQGVIKLSGEDTKTKRGRLVPISPVLENVLKKLPKICEYVFSYKGARLRDIRTAFALACQRAQISDFHFHYLRHCFVTRMRRKGVPDRVIMAITGHQTFECFKRYDTISLDDLKIAVDSFKTEHNLSTF